MSGTPIQLSITGLLIVFAVLAALAVVVSLVRRLDDRWQRAERSAEQAAFEKTPTVDQITLVLISAAVATHLTGRFRIRRVRRLLPRDAPSSPWSHQGRLVLQGSHVVSRRRS
jgi:Na+-transporting methylmalonyl-CoA/oxaloacetate decarboxylase gamma subunit